MTTGALAHILFLLLLLGPWVSLPAFRRQAAHIRAGTVGARIQLYRQKIIKLLIVAALLALLHTAGGVAAASLGWSAPHSWVQTIAVGVAIAAATFYVSVRIGAQAARALMQIKASPMGVMIPESNRERLWMGWLSVAAGVVEELWCRGFLFFYFATYLHLTQPALIVVTSSILFGLGHTYLGWRNAVGATVAGAILGALYLYTGSLVLPIVVHVIGDYRVLWVFPKAKVPNATAANP